MSDESWTPREQALEEEKLATYIAEQVIGHASGRLEDECLFNLPHDCYFIGSIRSKARENDENDNRLQQDLWNKLAPVAFGAEFLVRPEDGQMEIKVTLQWACYYRVFPTYAQQLDFVQAQSDEPTTDTPLIEREDGEEIGETEDDEDRIARQELERERRQAQDERRLQRDTLCPRFQKIPCSAVGNLMLRTNTNGTIDVEKSSLEDAVMHELQRAQQIASTDPERLRTDNVNLDAQVDVSNVELNSESEYECFKNHLRNEIPLSWAWEVQVECYDGESISNASNSGNKVVSINFTNSTVMPDGSLTREDFLFDTTAEFHFTNGCVIPFTLELAPRGFRYDRNVWGRGFNCAVEKLSETEYHTTHTPHFAQKRYLTSAEPTAPFETLGHNPIPVLESIRTAMSDSLEKWNAAEVKYQQQFGDKWEAEFNAEFERDKAKFISEIRRFERGLELVRTNSDIRLAFQLTNEVFRRAGDHPLPNKRKTEWRLFQIVFLVNQIPGIAALGHPQSPDASERDMVDIIYFPTGGGKTEAYLGVLVFHCFFDRLRGKCAGVTAWTRFPLRLLTLQQTQRIADIIGIAELVRREHSDPRLNGGGIAGFAVGYFVGKEGTPNELVNVDQYQWSNPEERLEWDKAQNEQLRQNWKRVVSCPSCRTNTVHVDFDDRAVRVRHRCTNENCEYHKGILPIYVIDNEIYRYLPSVIVGTIDKLATLGHQRKFSLILGKVMGICTDHGYYSGKCCQKDCTETARLRNNVPRGMSGPTLFIQDELHLLREGLGTFDAHYESFVQELLKQFGLPHTLKIIASSATIEAFDRQVEHLYARTQQQARIFPGPGPILGDSFYAETQDYPQRLFFGIIPHNKTIFNAILELFQYYHEAVQNLQQLSIDEQNPFGGRVRGGTSKWEALLDNYETSLAYFLAGRDLSSIRTDLDAHVNAALQQGRFRPLEIAEMTGDTNTDEVTRILEQLERTCPAQGEAPNAILATSMISHGVDIDRLNGMLFYGMPRQNAEYIQASSRIGRRHVGLVLTCLHPGRERDQSHYAYFAKYHEFLGQLIEPVAINRWSKFSVQRTLPGLFMSVLLQYIANSSGESNPNQFYMIDFVKRKISSGELSENNFIPILETAYGVTHPNNPAEEDFRHEIRRHVRYFLDQIVGAASHTKFVSAALIPRPMQSLRDVDEPVEIELDH